MKRLVDKATRLNALADEIAQLERELLHEQEGKSMNWLKLRTDRLAAARDEQKRLTRSLR